jgi:DNA-binding NarL/FixJ family response regulator
MPGIASNENKNRDQDVGGSSESRVIPIANSILICSSDKDIAKRWQESLNGVGELSIVSSCETLISRLNTCLAEVVLIDLDLFGEGYRELPESLCQRFPNISFIILSAMPNDDQGIYLISHGVKGYCNRYISKALLVKAVELVRMGEVWVGRSLLFKLMNRLISTAPPENRDKERKTGIDSQLAQLTDRESEIAKHIGAGESNKGIAKKLDITERTVKAHLSSIFRKTGTKDRLQLGLLINR